MKNDACKTNGNRGRKIKLPSSNWEARSRLGEHGRLRLQQCVPHCLLGKPVSVIDDGRSLVQEWACLCSLSWALEADRAVCVAVVGPKQQSTNF